MEQRASRARNAFLGGGADQSMHTAWGPAPGRSTPGAEIAPADAADARNGGVSAGGAPRGGRGGAADCGGAAADRGGAAAAPPPPESALGKHARVDEPTGAGKRARDDAPLPIDAILSATGLPRAEYPPAAHTQADALNTIRELHPQFVQAQDASTSTAPLVLDSELSLQLAPPAYAADGAAAARSVPPLLGKGAQAATTRTTAKVRPDQEKARAAFVAAHAGQTYEQMVLERAYSSDRLFWLKEAYGLTWRTGRWSQEEEDLATAALEKFCAHYRMSSADLDELIWHRKPEQKQLHEELWKHIALSVGTRPNYAVRMHIKSMRKDVVRGGRWTPLEAELLAAAVAELGHQWEKIGARLGRSGNTCKHYWREQMQNSHTAPAPQGAFRPEEEAALRRAVLECCDKVGCSPDGANLPWTLIHEHLGPSARRISVLSRKWRGMLSAEQRRPDEQNSRWYAPQDDHILLQRIRVQRPASTADIAFDQLTSPDWQWPMYVVKKHWTVMLRKRAPPRFRGSVDQLLDVLESKVPTADEYKLLASGRRPLKAPSPLGGGGDGDG
ncbi:hypothetical protein MSPP1_003326 [Malassezia sp. CBS 17886]|nr:hypothetical protein MSPP1_003326 [Malassezia sp. CBS 17886]